MTQWQRKDMFAAYLTVDGVNWGTANEAYIWATRTGGRWDSEAAKTFPGGMQDEVPLGGRRTTDDITLTRPYSDRDHGRVAALKKGVGRAQCTVSQYPLDGDGNVWGKPTIWSGILKSVAVPDVDAQATTEAAMIEVVVTVGGDSYVGA